MVGAFQTLVTRRVDVFDPAVVTVGSIRAGSTDNVIPETARLVGTIRAVSERTRTLVHTELERIATNIAAAHDMTVRFRIDDGFPVTLNDADPPAWGRAGARRIVRAHTLFHQPTPLLAAEALNPPTP